MIERRMIISPAYGEQLIKSNPNNRNVPASAVREKIASFTVCGGWIPSSSIQVERVDGRDILRGGMTRLLALKELGWPQGDEFTVSIHYYESGEWKREWSMGMNCQRKNSLSDDLKMAFGETYKKCRRTVCSSLYCALSGNARSIDAISFRKMNAAIGDLLDAYVVEAGDRGNPAPLSAGFILWDILNDGRRRGEMIEAKEEIRTRTGNPVLSRFRDYAREGGGFGLHSPERAWVYCWAAELYATGAKRIGPITLDMLRKKVYPFRAANIDAAVARYWDIVKKRADG